MAVLPEPQRAEPEQRQPRKRDCADEQCFGPTPSQHPAQSHACGSEWIDFLACRNAAASPSANARCTSLFGALKPRCSYASHTQAASPIATVTPKAAAALSAPAARLPITGTSLSISRSAYLSKKPARAPPPTAPLNRPKVRGVHPRLVAPGQRLQHRRDHAGETADPDNRDRNRASAGRRHAAAID